MQAGWLQRKDFSRELILRIGGVYHAMMRMESMCEALFAKMARTRLCQYANVMMMDIARGGVRHGSVRLKWRMSWRSLCAGQTAKEVGKRGGWGWGGTGGLGLGSNGGGKPQKNNMFAISEVLLKAKIAELGT